MTLFESWSLLISAGALVVNAVLFVLFALQLRLLRQQIGSADRIAVEEGERRRKEATLEFYATTLEKRAAFRGLLPHDRDAAAVGAFLSTIESPGDERDRVVMEYVGYFELLATSINVEVLDFETLARVSGSRIRAIWTNYEPWILGRRERFGNERLYNELERLVDRLNEENRRLGYTDQRPSSAPPAV